MGCNVSRLPVTVTVTDSASEVQPGPCSKPGKLPTLGDGRSLQVSTLLGEGGFGYVQLVTDGEQHYALKVMNKGQLLQLKQQRLVLREVQIQKLASHPFLVRLLCSYQDSHHLYLLLDAAMGGELFTYVSKQPKFQLPFDQTRFYVANVAAALEFLHSKGIIYRDLKLENLLLDGDGYVKVCDFGLSKMVGKDGRTHTECGTAVYNAPEMVQSGMSAEGYSMAVDFWALGVLTYEMLVGDVPFDAEESEEVVALARDKLRTDDFFASHLPEHIAADDNCGLLLTFLEETVCVDPAQRPSRPSQHGYLSCLDGTKLVAHELPAPHVPKVATPLDASNFKPPARPEIATHEHKLALYWDARLQAEPMLDRAFSSFNYSNAPLMLGNRALHGNTIPLTRHPPASAAATDKAATATKWTKSIPVPSPVSAGVPALSSSSLTPISLPPPGTPLGPFASAAGVPPPTAVLVPSPRSPAPIRPSPLSQSYTADSRHSSSGATPTIRPSPLSGSFRRSPLERASGESERSDSPSGRRKSSRRMTKEEIEDIEEDAATRVNAHMREVSSPEARRARRNKEQMKASINAVMFAQKLALKANTARTSAAQGGITVAANAVDEVPSVQQAASPAAAHTEGGSANQATSPPSATAAAPA